MKAKETSYAAMQFPDLIFPAHTSESVCWKATNALPILISTYLLIDLFAKHTRYTILD